MFNRTGEKLPASEKISGPLLDRIDTLCDVEVPRVPFDKLSDKSLRPANPAKSTEAGQGSAGTTQQGRFKDTTLQTNADSAKSPREITQAIQYRPILRG